MVLCMDAVVVNERTVVVSQGNRKCKSETNRLKWATCGGGGQGVSVGGQGGRSAEAVKSSKAEGFTAPDANSHV